VPNKLLRLTKKLIVESQKQKRNKKRLFSIFILYFIVPGNLITMNFLIFLLQLYNP